MRVTAAAFEMMVSGRWLSPLFVILMKRQALLARFRSAQIGGFKSRRRNIRSSRNGGAGPEPPVSVVAEACHTRFLRLVERQIPRLVACRDQSLRPEPSAHFLTY